MGTIVVMLAFLRRGGSHEDRQVSVARKIARTANPVLNPRSHDVRRIHVAVDIGFNHSIHPDHAQAADHLGMVGNFLRAKHDLLAEVCHFGVDLRPHFGLRENAVAEAQVSLPLRRSSIMPS
jgi:hypothetical protein